MHEKILYENKKNLKIFFIAELLLGLMLPILFYYFYKAHIYIGFFTIAAPLLGLALINAALKDDKIKEINYNELKNCIEIKKQSLMDISAKEINIANLGIELRGDYRPEDAQFIIRIGKKIKLTIFDAGKKVEIMESGFFSRNNSTITKLYNNLKVIQKTAIILHPN